MKAIQTRYLGPTNYRGSRIKATAEGGHSVTIGYPHEYNTEQAHWQACKALLAKTGWQWTEVASGGLPNGDYVWCCISQYSRFKYPEAA